MKPIPQLNRTDADTTLFFLAANALRYVSSVDDAWFSAHKQFTTANESLLINGNRTPYENQSWFMSDSLVHVLACADQSQLCNPSTNECSPLVGESTIMEQLPALGLNEYQNQTAMTILTVGTKIFSSKAIVGSLKSNALLASQLLADNMALPLPDNQWMLEVSSWFATGLAGLQQSVVEYATGPSPAHTLAGNPSPLLVVGDANSTVSRTLCKSQMGKLTGEYQNFSVLGLLCILVIGGVIMLVSLNVETLGGYVQRKMKRGEEGRFQWMADSNFQVQMMMYEGRGYVKWRGRKDTVPVYFGDDLQFSAELEDVVSGSMIIVAARAIEDVESVEHVGSKADDKRLPAGAKGRLHWKN